MRDVSRIDRLIRELETAQNEADEIFNTHLDAILCEAPPRTSYGAIRHREIGQAAGGQINYVNALRHLRDRYLKR